MKTSSCVILKPAILPGSKHSNFWYLLRPMCFITRCENQKKRQTCPTYGLSNLSLARDSDPVPRNISEESVSTPLFWISPAQFRSLLPISQTSVLIFGGHRETQIVIQSIIYQVYVYQIFIEVVSIDFTYAEVKSMSTCFLLKTKTLTQNKIVIKWNLPLKDSHSSGY